MDTLRLVEKLLRQEDDLRRVPFLAPRIPGGRLRVRIDGLIHDFEARPADFEGWGVFRAIDSSVAELVRPAEASEIERYLGHLLPLRFRLVKPLFGTLWLACPVNQDDARRRLGSPEPRAVHLVANGTRFEGAQVRFDGAQLWFEGVDHRADPRLADALRHALADKVQPEDLNLARLTPEDRLAYRLAHTKVQRRPRVARPQVGAERRVERALHRGGGSLRDLRDRGEHWQVEWTDSRGRAHLSAVRKSDFTVLSAGLCLDGHDREFDLTSLVGVVDEAPRWAF